MKKIIGLLALAIFALSVVPAEAQKKATKKSETVTLVTNLDCENCAKKILNVIPFKKGVKDMSVDVPTKVVEVKFDPRKTSVEVLVEELKKLDVAVLSINGNPMGGECPHCKDGHKAECKGECKDCKGECKDCKGEHKGEHKDCKGECKDHKHEGHDHHHHNHAGHNHNHAGHNHAH